MISFSQFFENKKILHFVGGKNETKLLCFRSVPTCTKESQKLVFHWYTLAQVGTFHLMKMGSYIVQHGTKEYYNKFV